MTCGASRYLCSVMLAGVLAAGIGCTKAPDDSQATQQIQTRLNQDSGLQGKGITVQTTAGVVTLSGTVDNDTQRTAAARYASETAGIKQVVNNLVVGGVVPAVAAAPEATPDSAVKKEVAQAPPPVRMRQETKPRPSTPRHAKSEVPDQDFWDKGKGKDQSDSTSQNNTMASAAPVASSTPAATPAAPPPPPEPKKWTVQSGTVVAIRLVDPIDSETAQAGQTFRATLDSPLASEGDIAIPSGYNVEGHVVDVKSAGKFAGQSLLVLQLDRIMVGGKSYSVQTNQYRRQGNNRTTNTAEKVGAGAVIGAIIGGIAGGGKGAGIGAAAGGGVGGGVQAAGKGQQIKLASESVLNFTLESPVTVTQVDKGPDAGRPKLDSPK